MNNWSRRVTLSSLCAGSVLGFCALLPDRAVSATGTNSAAIRTPTAPATPRINGPAIFGVRPGSPFLYRIPATGERPMEFSVKGLPSGLRVDSQTGEITGSLKKAGEAVVMLRAKNAKGALGCDLDQMDDFTLNLLTNDEVLAVNQDALGKQARCVVKEGDLRVYAKDLADGSKAVGLFNLGETESTVTAPWSELKLRGKLHVRDLWRQKELGKFDSEFRMAVASHAAELVKISKFARLAK